MKRKNGNRQMKKPLIYKPERPTMFGSRAVYGVVMWGLFVLAAKFVYCSWPELMSLVPVAWDKTPLFTGMVASALAGYLISLLIGIYGMFVRPGDKDNNPDTVDHSVEVPPSGAPPHGLREKGYITPDIMNPFTLFYLYQKVVDVVGPDNKLYEQKRWMWSWIRGLGNLMDVGREPTADEVLDMKAGGVYNNPAPELTDFKKLIAEEIEKAGISRETCPTMLELEGVELSGNKEVLKALSAIRDIAEKYTSGVVYKEDFDSLTQKINDLERAFENRKAAVTKAAMKKILTDPDFLKLLVGELAKFKTCCKDKPKKPIPAGATRVK